MASWQTGVVSKKALMPAGGLLLLVLADFPPGTLPGVTRRSSEHCAPCTWLIVTESCVALTAPASSKPMNPLQIS